ncbi:MAG: hypothetical protein OWS74_02240, partial [Firmicutes bacterium]|nr:hypothetical protein [Bacillota bacterium]
MNEAVATALISVIWPAALGFLIFGIKAQRKSERLKKRLDSLNRSAIAEAETAAAAAAHRDSLSRRWAAGHGIALRLRWEEYVLIVSLGFLG